jgi:hypothetical protein
VLTALGYDPTSRPDGGVNGGTRLIRRRAPGRCCDARGPTEQEIDAGVPDAVAVRDGAGELVGWDESAVHAYLAAHGLHSSCDDDCVARGDIEPW